MNRMTITPERKAFEEWCLKNDLDTAPEHELNEETYFYPKTEGAWMAWQAAIAAHGAAKWLAPDELPDDCRDVLIVGSLSGLPSKTHTGYFYDGRWKSIIDDQQTGDALPITNVTAWQEMPKLPMI